MTRHHLEIVAEALYALNLALYDELPISDVPRRWTANNMHAANHGHDGDCVKQPQSCALCTFEKYLERAAKAIAESDG